MEAGSDENALLRLNKNLKTYHTVGNFCGGSNFTVSMVHQKATKF